MILFLLLFTELFILFFLSRRLTQGTYDLCILLFRARSVAITIITILNFPGTVIHELSHLFTAEVLGVRTGKLTLVPESIQKDPSTSLGTEIKAGSVMIAATDPFRRYLIGLAPIVTGLVAITAISYTLFQYVPNWGSWEVWGYWGGGYLLLVISNAMFSSAEDLKGFLPFIITLGIMIAAAYVAGFRVGITGPALSVSTQILDALTKSLGGVLALNIIGIILTKGLILLTEKLSRRKILRRY
ncbi:MAG: hypothetical protein NTY06_04525 [Candidatus Gottesmanbacteria bacterium]|nr:hypothetical protein [Candidatus Gottesmanbacteria bacterium]